MVHSHIAYMRLLSYWLHWGCKIPAPPTQLAPPLSPYRRSMAFHRNFPLSSYHCNVWIISSGSCLFHCLFHASVAGLCARYPCHSNISSSDPPVFLFYLNWIVAGSEMLLSPRCHCPVLLSSGITWSAPSYGSAPCVERSASSSLLPVFSEVYCFWIRGTRSAPGHPFAALSLSGSARFAPLYGCVTCIRPLIPRNLSSIGNCTISWKLHRTPNRRHNQVSIIWQLPICIPSGNKTVSGRTTPTVASMPATTAPHFSTNLSAKPDTLELSP